MTEAGFSFHVFYPVLYDNVIPYQPFTGADCSSSSHMRCPHSPKEVAGVPLREPTLCPVSAAIPPLQDVVI